MAPLLLGARAMRFFNTLLLFSFLIGCDTPSDAPAPDSGSDTEAIDASDGAADGASPTPLPAAPQVQNRGGPVLTAPNVVPIFFPSDPGQPKIEDFLSQLAGSAFWDATTKEYGVGPLGVNKSVVVTDTPPTSITTDGIRSWLASYLDGTHAAWPPIAQNNIYTIFYPASTTVVSDSAGTSCVNFYGTHSEVMGVASNIVYAVIPRCAGNGPVMGFDETTSALSHELVEAATDPLVGSAPAWLSVDADHLIWNVAPGAEVGDLCSWEPQSYQRLVGTYMVQRTWSNASALAGHDPCVPLLSAPYFNAAPVLSDTVVLGYHGQQLPTKGIRIPLNQSKTIDVQLFSDGVMGDWTLQANDYTDGTGNPKELVFSWDKTSGNSGDTVHLTITRVANGAFLGSPFFIWPQRGGLTNLWVGFVAN